MVPDVESNVNYIQVEDRTAPSWGISRTYSMTSLSNVPDRTLQIGMSFEQHTYF